MKITLVLYVFHIYNERVQHFIDHCIFKDDSVDFFIYAIGSVFCKLSNPAKFTTKLVYWRGEKNLDNKYCENNGGSPSRCDLLYNGFKMTGIGLDSNLVETYGNKISKLNKYYNEFETGGELIFGDFYEFEVKYLVKEEMARTSEDILFRRTKLGINFPKEAKDKLEIILKRHL